MYGYPYISRDIRTYPGLKDNFHGYVLQKRMSTDFHIGNHMDMIPGYPLSSKAIWISAQRRVSGAHIEMDKHGYPIILLGYPYDYLLDIKLDSQGYPFGSLM
jgi:hypothetical protein